ncbi:MAG: ATP-binding protein [Terracidiphilus sp.]|jgi:signal transduction histidine kinase
MKMDERPGNPTEQIKHLQRCVNDLVSVLALPAMWSGGEPSQIVHTLLDALLRMLQLDLVYVRLKETSGQAPIEIVRFDQSRKQLAPAHEIGEIFKQQLGTAPQQWPQLMRIPLGDRNISIVPLGLGLQNEIGFIVAGSERADFPQQTERLILSVAANQASIGLQEAWFRWEQKRIASELDQRVAQRTSELAAANEKLRKEIADRKQAEDQLRASERNLQMTQAELARISRLTTMGELAASIAHEVNQPLTAVINNGSACLRLLANRKLEPEVLGRTLEGIVADGNRASAVLARIRAFIKKVPAEKNPLDINDVIQEVLVLAGRELYENQVLVGRQLTTNLPLVLADRVQLQQVLLNLIMNGIEALIAVTNRPRLLWVQSRIDESGDVLVAVSDSGTGFNFEVDHVFTPFFTTKAKGMGMGLSISRSLVESHGGRLWATPNSPHGAVFSFALPATEGSPS